MDFAREPKRAPGVQFSSDVAPTAESASQQALHRSRSVFSETSRFQRADRILCTRDFTRAIKTGKRGTSKSFVVVMAPRIEGLSENSDEKRSRLGVTVSKRVGNSVTRNRVKRRIREWFRHAREGLPDGSDIVVIARQTARDLSGSKVAAVLDRMIHDAEARGDGRTTTGFR
jgi:ribonuclease P protein component